MKTVVLLALSAVLVQSAFAGITLFASETQAGTLGGNTSLYGGVQQYNFFMGPLGAVSGGVGIPANQLSDPGGILFHGGSLYVGNRHGNILGQGSVKQFPWNGTAISPGTTIATASNAAYQGFHGFGFAPNGDLWVSTVSGGSRRYRNPGSGFVDIGGSAAGNVRDAWVSPDGLKLFETGIGNQIFVSDVTSSGVGSRTAFTVNGSSAMHQLAYSGGSLYTCGFYSNTIHKIVLDGNYNPVSSSVVANSNQPIGIAITADGNTMFVSSHTGNTITRFSLVGSTWTIQDSFATGRNMGYLTLANATDPKVSGRIALANYVGNNLGDTLTAEVYNGATLVETITQPIGIWGGFSLNPTGTNVTRTIKFRTHSGLQKSVAVFLAPTGTHGLIVNMQNGDVDNSGEVDAVDIDLVIASFGATTPNINADVDGSREVDAVDIDIVIANFGGVDN